MKVTTKKTRIALVEGILKQSAQVECYGTTIHEVRELKYLGILIDERQNFYRYIEKVCAKATSLMQMRVAQRK